MGVGEVEASMELLGARRVWCRWYNVIADFVTV